MQDFRNLKVWQKAHDLALLVYRLTADFPREETFGLRHSLRKAAVDIPAMIAEGSGKSSDHEFSRSLGTALGLSTRLEYYALMAHDLELVDTSNHERLAGEIIDVKKMLSGFNRNWADQIRPEHAKYNERSFCELPQRCPSFISRLQEARRACDGAGIG